MNKRIIAVGNRLMTDDAIGIIVTEKIRNWLIKEKFDVIIGETDIDYYTSFINKGDLIIFIDAKYEGGNPGEISVSNLDIKNNLCLTSQHDRYFLNSIGERVSGYLIGIEIASLDIGVELSSLLKERLLNICMQVKQYIKLIEYNSSLGE